VELLRAKRNVKGLMKALRYDKDDSVCEAAAKALCDVGDARAIEPLVSVLEDSGAVSVRAATARALGSVGDETAIAPLIKALSDEDAGVRAAAATALGSVGDTTALETLDALIERIDEPSEVKEAAKSARGDIMLRAHIHALHRRTGHAKIDAAVEALVEVGERAVSPLIEILRDRDYRDGVAQALGGIGDRRAVDPLLAVLWRGGPVADALGVIGDRRALRPLILVMEYGGPRAQASASTAIKGIARRNIPAVVSLLRDSQLSVCEAAADVLILFGNEECVDPLINILTNTHATALARNAAGEEVDHSKYSVRERAAEALGHIGDYKAVRPLIEVLDDESPGVRQKAAEALGVLGAPLAIDPLVELLLDPELMVTEAAEEALAALDVDAEREKEALVEHLINVLTNGHPTAPARNAQAEKISRSKYVLPERAAEALGRTGDDKAVRPLIGALEDERLEVRRKAAEALGVLGAPLAIDPLIERLFDPQRPVSEAAEEALALLNVDVEHQKEKRARKEKDEEEERVTS